MQRRHQRSWRAISRGWTCDHREMRYCCDKPCGHLLCPCGVFWDDAAHGDWEDDGEWWKEELATMPQVEPERFSVRVSFGIGPVWAMQRSEYVEAK